MHLYSIIYLIMPYCTHFKFLSAASLKNQPYTVKPGCFEKGYFGMTHKSPNTKNKAHSLLLGLVGFILLATCLSLLPISANAAEDTTPPVVIVPPATVTSLEIGSMPEKTEYFEGDALVLDGAKLKINYSDGENETVSIDPSWVKYDFSKAGEQSVTVSYQECTCSFTVNVKKVEVTSIKITKFPNKTQYFVGDVIDHAGISVTAYYNNGTEKVIDKEIVLSEIDSSTPGEKEISAMFGTFTDSFTVSVIEPTVAEITIITLPKINYYDGEEFSSDGCVVSVLYNSLKREEITEGLVFSGFDPFTLGEQVVTLQFGGRSTTFTVTVSLSPHHQHTPNETEHTVVPTCTEGGLDTVTCRVCSEKISETVLSALGHSFGELTIITPPSGTENGLQSHTCSVCGFSEEMTIEKLSNTLTSGNFTVELLGANCFFPYLSELNAEDAFSTLSYNAVMEFNTSLSQHVKNPNLLALLKVSIVLPSGEAFTPECPVRITYKCGFDTYSQLFTLLGDKLTGLEYQNGAITFTCDALSDFLVFASIEDETSPPTETNATPPVSGNSVPQRSGNTLAAVLLLFAIVAIIGLIVVIYVYVIKKFYY